MDIARVLTLESIDHTQVMGLLSVTPDSFSDGGCYTSLESAVECARADTATADEARYSDLLANYRFQVLLLFLRYLVSVGLVPPFTRPLYSPTTAEARITLRSVKP